MTSFGPHSGQRVERAGVPLGEADAVLLMAHGRGAEATDMLALARQIGGAKTAVVAPQAAGRSWWPASFLAPLDRNEPWLSSALTVFEEQLAEIAAAGVPPQRTVIGGFSQGACLALEFAARHPARYGAVIALSGGLVGTADGDGAPREDLYGFADKRFDYAGDMGAAPVLLACHALDPHIPLARVERSAKIFDKLGAEVTARIEPGQGHGVTAEAVTLVRDLVGRIHV